MKDVSSTVSALVAALSERERQLLLQALQPPKRSIAIVGIV